MRQSALSTPESAASPSAALERLLGVARTHGPFSNSGTMPRVVSAQIASGLVFRAASVASSGMPAAIAAASLGRIRSPFQRLYHDVGCVDFRREQFGGHVNDDLAGPSPPSLVIVAEVPMQRTSFPGASRSRKRLTSIATSAPCRPR